MTKFILPIFFIVLQDRKNHKKCLRTLGYASAAMLFEVQFRTLELGFA
jgi:hypothetical protein